MRRFVLRVTAFCIPIAIALMSLEWYMRSLPNSYRQKEEWMEHNSHRVEVLIMGNSHALYGIRPCMFHDVAYNLSNVSQTLEYDEFLLRRYLPRCPRLKSVLLIVDNSNFFDPPLEQTESYRCTYYQIYMHCAKHSPWGRYGFEIANIAALKEKLLQDSIYIDSLGAYVGNTLRRRDAECFSTQTVDATADRHSQRNERDVQVNKSHLDNIVRLCREHGIRLYLVQAPVTTPYYQRLPLREREFVRQCCRYEGVVTSDFSQDIHFTEDDFFDPDHLSAPGAVKWSRMLSSMVY